MRASDALNFKVGGSTASKDVAHTHLPDVAASLAAHSEQRIRLQLTSQLLGIVKSFGRLDPSTSPGRPVWSSGGVKPFEDISFLVDALLNHDRLTSSVSPRFCQPS